MRRFGCVLLVFGVACSGPPAGTAVRVTVTGNVPAFDHLAITLSADGTTRTPAPIAQGSIPPDIVFGVDVPRSLKGPLHVEVAAQDAANVSLATKAGDANLSPGHVVDLMLVLGSSGDDGGATDDLANADFAIPENADLAQGPPDLRPPVPAKVTLAEARALPTNGLGTRKFVDLNKDGKLDILDTNSANFAVALNRGDGTFGSLTTYTRLGTAQFVDLNNDGLTDVVNWDGNQHAMISVNDGMGGYPMSGTMLAFSMSCSNFQVVDLNKDAKPDLLCFLNGGGNPAIEVFINNGMGVFPATPANYPIPKPGSLVAVADFTGDGAPEVFIENTSTEWVSYFNDGMGGFNPSPSPAPTTFNGQSPTSIQLVDVSGDGKADALILNSNQLQVATGKGDGTFNASATTSFPTSVGITLVDLNGDGFKDILGFGGGQLVPALNNGSGGFPLTATALTTSTGVGNYQLVDLNKDGKTDIVATEGTTADVFLNNGNGTFANRAPYAINSGSVILLDVNKDGYLDLLTTTPTGFGVLLNNKSGAFGTRADITVPANTSGILFNDLTGDGAPEAWGASSSTGLVFYLKNDGMGGFAAPITADLNSVFSSTSVSGVDLTGDGVADLVSSISYIATSSGAPDFPTVLTTGGTAISAVVADFKPDGKPDIVFVQGTTNMGAFINMGGGVFAAEADYTVGTNGNRIAAGHIKSATSLDVAVANSTTQDVSVLIGNGDGTFQTKVDYPLGATAQTLALGDLNHDGFDDLAVGLSTQNIGVLLNNGSGIFSPKNDYAGTAFTELYLADLNNDQRPDVVTCYAGGSPQSSVLINDGTGKFAAKTDLTWTGVTLASVRLIDLSGDGAPDLVASVTPPTNYKLTLRTNNGNGTFGAPSDLVTDGQRYAFGDLNRDGRIDLVVWFANTLRVLIQDANGVFQPGSEYYMPSASILEVADFDGDGLAEVLCGGLNTRLHVLRNVSR